MVAEPLERTQTPLEKVAVAPDQPLTELWIAANPVVQAAACVEYSGDTRLLAPG
jgi:hypothetical protein